MSGGRPRRPDPPGLGVEKDIVVALAEGMTPQAVYALRRVRGIPAPGSAGVSFTDADPKKVAGGK